MLIYLLGDALNPITKKEFILKSKKISYCKGGRWVYSEVAINLVMSKNIKSCLEVGPGFLPLFKDSDLLSMENWQHRKLKFTHNCDEIPWPIEDKAYDCSIALQVWEHLKKPIEAFQELKRISKNIILSLPYKYHPKSKDIQNSSHCDIDEKKIKEWTNLEPTDTYIIKNQGSNIVCFYEVL